VTLKSIPHVCRVVESLEEMYVKEGGARTIAYSMVEREDYVDPTGDSVWDGNKPPCRAPVEIGKFLVMLASDDAEEVRIVRRRASIECIPLHMVTEIDRGNLHEDWLWRVVTTDNHPERTELRDDPSDSSLDRIMQRAVVVKR